MPRPPDSTQHVDALLRSLGERVRHGDLARLLRCGPYTLLQLIGRGGIASVYAAVRDGEDRPRYAIKVFDPGVDAEELLARFAREHTIIRGISHPRIVHVIDSGIQETGQPWFAMPLVNGMPVTREADAHRLGMAERLLLAERACEGVAAAHAAQVIHRDIKPGNIVASWAEPEPEVRLIDFGLARAIASGDRRITPAGALRRMGTPDYMAPEQWSDGIAACDTRADVFSTGMLIAELASGTIARQTSAPSARSASRRSASSRHARVAPGTPCAPSESLERLIDADPSAAAELAHVRRMRSARELQEAVRSLIDPLVAPMLAKDPDGRPPDARAALPMIEATRRAM